MYRYSGFQTHLEGLFVQFQELGRDTGLDGGQPFLGGDVEILGKSAHQDDVDGLAGTGGLRQRQGVDGVHIQILGLHLLQQVLGILCRADDDGHGRNLLGIGDDLAAGL